MPASSLMSALVLDGPIPTAELIAIVHSPAHGAVVSFSGDVRNHDEGREVVGLTYEAHPSANEVLERVVLACLAAHDRESADPVRVAIAHRTGALRPGDCAFFVAVAAAHRKAAFEICSALVDQVKAELPVWKHQEFADGTHEWVNFA